MATPLTVTPPTRLFASLRPAPPPAPPPRSAILKIPANTPPLIHPRTTAPLPPPNQAGPVPQTLAAPTAQTLAVLLPQGRTTAASQALLSYKPPTTH
jgi:hypothetical protein